MILSQECYFPKEVDEEGNEEDPRAELVEKLLEYKLYKAMAQGIKGQAYRCRENLL